jgi:hypothetical protein
MNRKIKEPGPIWCIWRDACGGRLVLTFWRNEKFQYILLYFARPSGLKQFVTGAGFAFGESATRNCNLSNINTLAYL